MGETGALRKAFEYTVMAMEEKRTDGVSPYRMNQIIRTAAAMTEQLVNGKYMFQPTYHECEIAIELVAEAIKKSKNEYRRK